MMDHFRASDCKLLLSQSTGGSALFFWLPQLVGSALFAIGFIGQFFRAQQDRLLIALGCIYFLPFWLVLLAAPHWNR